MLGGVFSGLTLGLLSLDLTSLKVLCLAGTVKEQIYAKRIVPLVERHHLLLVTLLLCNAITMEALPLFLGKLVNEYVAPEPFVLTILPVCCRKGKGKREREKDKGGNQRKRTQFVHVLAP